LGAAEHISGALRRVMRCDVDVDENSELCTNTILPLIRLLDIINNEKVTVEHILSYCTCTV
jgi:hypothetical protein